MRYIQKAVVLAFLVVFMWLFGCEDWSTDPPPPESIATTNKIRRERGVREIKKAWTFYGRRSGAEIWKEHPERNCKTVHYDKSYNATRIEYDKYYSGRTFVSDPDQVTFRETLFINYFYGPDRFSINVRTDNKQIESMVYGLKKWMEYPSPYDGGYLTYGRMDKTNEETLEVADKILKMWGLERL